MAAAPGSPWGGGEGLTNNSCSDLLTTRMLAQRKEWSNAPTRDFIHTSERQFKERRSKDRKKIPGLVPALLKI